MNQWHLTKACYHLKQGGVIAYPTEAVYGLGCDPWNHSAVKQLLALKNRPWQKGLILVAADYQQIMPFIQPIGEDLKQHLLTTWQQQSITWLLPAHPRVPTYLRGESSKIALRISQHGTVRALCQAWGGAIVSTSANITGLAAAYNTFDVRHHFKNRLDYIVQDHVGGATRPSEIRDALTQHIVRS